MGSEGLKVVGDRMLQTGALVLVVGPSGAGKDTLIDVARLHFADDRRVVFVQRAITRPVDAGGEAHLPMPPDVFDASERAGAFALSWRSHGLAYGIPGTIAVDLGAGRVVVANVSRGVMAAANEICRRRVVVHVTAQADVLAQRLAARGREQGDTIEGRLKRAAKLEPAGAELIEIDNTGPIAVGGRKLVDIIAGLVPVTPAGPLR